MLYESFHVIFTKYLPLLSITSSEIHFYEKTTWSLVDAKFQVACTALDEMKGKTTVLNNFLWFLQIRGKNLHKLVQTRQLMPQGVRSKVIKRWPQENWLATLSLYTVKGLKKSYMIYYSNHILSGPMSASW